MLSDKTFRFVFRGQPSISLEYLDHVLKAPALRQQIMVAATGTSPSMKNISKEKVLRLLIPKRAPDQQERSVAHLRALQTRLAAIQIQAKRMAGELHALMPSILDRAFKGGL